MIVSAENICSFVCICLSVFYFFFLGGGGGQKVVRFGDFWPDNISRVPEVLDKKFAKGIRAYAAGEGKF